MQATKQTTTRGADAASRAPTGELTPWTPTVSYEECILTRAQEIAASLTRPDDTPERVAARLNGSIANLRERFEAWQALGEHYADVLEDPQTSVVLYNSIRDELDELADQAKLFITTPEVLRLLYPMLRQRVEARKYEALPMLLATHPKEEA